MIKKSKLYAAKEKQKKTAWLRKLTVQESAKILENLLNFFNEPAFKKTRHDHPVSLQNLLTAQRQNAQQPRSSKSLPKNT